MHTHILMKVTMSLSVVLKSVLFSIFDFAGRYKLTWEHITLTQNFPLHQQQQLICISIFIRVISIHLERKQILLKLYSDVWSFVWLWILESVLHFICTNFKSTNDEVDSWGTFSTRHNIRTIFTGESCGIFHAWKFFVVHKRD